MSEEILRLYLSLTEENKRIVAAQIDELLKHQRKDEVAA